jgi:hypothetical protein
MSNNKPPYPSFPPWCFYAITVCVVCLIICIITLIATGNDEKNNDEKNNDETIETKQISGTLAVFFIISILGLLLFGGGCSTWYNYAKHRWVMQYGTQSQKNTLMIQDTVEAVSGLANALASNRK